MQTNTRTTSSLFSSVVNKQPTNDSITVIAPAAVTNDAIRVFNLKEASGEQIVMFGNDRQKEFGTKLDAVLVELTKGTNPVLFQLFDRLSKGMKDVNIPELEKEITESQNTSLGGKLLQAFGLSSVAKRLEESNKRIFAYYAKYTGTKADIESEINFAAIKLPADLRKMILNGSKLIVRPIKFILQYFSNVQCRDLLKEMTREQVNELYAGCLGEGYYKIPVYQPNFQLIQHAAMAQPDII